MIEKDDVIRVLSEGPGKFLLFWNAEDKLTESESHDCLTCPLAQWLQFRLENHLIRADRGMILRNANDVILRIEELPENCKWYDRFIDFIDNLSEEYALYKRDQIVDIIESFITKEQKTK